MKVNYRQLSILVFMSFIALKFLALPCLLYKESGNMSWLVALTLMIVDGVYAFFIIELMHKNQNKNVYEFMCETLGVVLTKIFLFILMLKYIFTIVNITKSLENFVISNFYSELSWVLFALPLIGVVGFMCYKGIQNIGRVFEMFFWAIVLGCVYIALKSIMKVDLFNFLPLFKQGVKPIFDSAFIHANWFGSATFLIMLFGKIDFKEQKRKKMVCYIIASIALVTLIYFVFYGIFGITSPTHNFAISDISQFVRGSSIIDELSWLIIALWIVAQTIQIAMYGFAFVVAFTHIFNVKVKIVPIIILDLIMFSWGIINREVIYLEEIFFHPATSIMSIIAQYIIPIFLWIGYAVKNSKMKKEGKRESSLETNI